MCGLHAPWLENQFDYVHGTWQLEKGGSLGDTAVLATFMPIFFGNNVVNRFEKKKVWFVYQ